MALQGRVVQARDARSIVVTTTPRTSPVSLRVNTDTPAGRNPASRREVLPQNGTVTSGDPGPGGASKLGQARWRGRTVSGWPTNQ